MRKYLFRGKNAKGEWEYGDLITGDQYGPYIRNRALIYVGVDSETVGQFTGLKDCDGREIYEGDVIASSFADYKAVVEFRNGAFIAVTGPVDTYQALYGVLRLKGLRVIGNVHDNSDLLEATHD